ncbi:MAG TPA: histidine kinase, partial [Clostridium sp.]|nr:histidine kinase [Clostridium sp.]
MIIKEFPLSKLFTELVLPPIPVSILCCISIWILSGYKTDFHKAEKYFLTSYLIGMVLQTGSYVIVFPLLIAVTIAELKNSKDMMDTLKVLMAIFSIYFVEVMLKALNGAYFYWKDSSRIKNYAMVYAVVPAGVFLISILKNTVFKGRNRYAKDSLWRARLRLMFALSIPIMVSIRLIYPYVNSRSYGSFSFVIDWYIPIAIPLFSIVLILFIIYNYEKSIGIQVELKREVEERHRLEEYASVVEEMYGQTRKFKHDYKNMLLPLKGYIDSEDTKGLKKFFYENVMHIDDHINWSSTNI